MFSKHAENKNILCTTLFIFYAEYYSIFLIDECEKNEILIFYNNISFAKHETINNLQKINIVVLNNCRIK